MMSLRDLVNEVVSVSEINLPNEHAGSNVDWELVRVDGKEFSQSLLGESTSLCLEEVTR